VRRIAAERPAPDWPQSSAARAPLRAVRRARRLGRVLAALACGVVLAAAMPRSAAEPLTLAQLLVEVRQRNPQLRAAASTAAADRERIAQAGAWEDPVAGLEVMREGTNRLTTYSAAEFSLSQKIPLSGNRERRRAVASAEADVSAATVRAREFMLQAEARDAFFQLLRAREQLALTRETEKLLAQATEIARSRLATGSTEVNALLLAENERTRLGERVIALERESADAAATLNTLRDLPPQAPVGELAAPAALAGGSALPTDAFPSLEEAQAHALAHRPEIQEAYARVTAAQRARELAERAWRPDPEVMVKARHLNAGSQVIEGYDTGIAVSLPWFNDGKYRAAQREADRRREAAELDAAALRTKTAGEVREMWTRLATARRTLALYRDQLLPLARQSADNVRQAIVTGKATVRELVEAQRILVDTQTTLAASVSDFHRYQAMLALLTGAPDQP
jgi:outer membrane protein TolC